MLPQTAVFLDRFPTFAEGVVMNLLQGMPSRPPSTDLDATPEQLLNALFVELATAESHFLTTDSEVMRRREIPATSYLMLSFPQACIYFYVASERLYWNT